MDVSVEALRNGVTKHVSDLKELQEDTMGALESAPTADAYREGLAALATLKQEYVTRRAHAIMLESVIHSTEEMPFPRCEQPSKRGRAVKTFPVNKQDVATLEAEVAALREAAAPTARHPCHDTIQAVREHSNAIVALMAEVSSLASSVQSQVDELGQLEAEMAELGGELPTAASTGGGDAVDAADATDADGDVDMGGSDGEEVEAAVAGEPATVDGCHAALAAQIGSIQSLTESIAHLDEKADDLESQLRESQAELGPLKQRADQLIGTAQRAAAKHAGHAGKLATMSQWYTRTTAALSAVNGVQAVAASQDGVTFRLNPSPALYSWTLPSWTPPAAHDLVVRVKEEAGGVRLVDVKLCPPPGVVAVFIDDIVRHASRAEATGGDVDVAALVAEVHSRLHCASARVAHIDILRECFAATTSASTDSITARPTRVTFTLPCRVVVTARITADYPKPAAAVFVEDITAVGWTAAARDAADLSSARDDLNRGHFSSLLHLARTASDRFAPLAPPAPTMALSMGSAAGTSSSSDTMGRFLRLAGMHSM